MLQSKKILIASLTIALLLILITSTFFSIVAAQSVNSDDVIILIKDWEEKKIQNSQWVNIITAFTLMEPQGVILPNGEPMPSSYITDDWFYVNDAGLVEKGVFSIKDNNGNILQQSAFQNNVLINFTFDDRQENQDFFSLNIDLGLAQQIREASNQGLKINKSDETVEGRPSVMYFYTEELKLPTQLGADSVIVDSIVQKGFFDAETKDFVQLQTVWVLSDGTELVYVTVYIISIDSYSSPNDEILKILEGVK